MLAWLIRWKEKTISNLQTWMRSRILKLKSLAAYIQANWSQAQRVPAGILAWQAVTVVMLVLFWALINVLACAQWCLRSLRRAAAHTGHWR